MDFIKRMHDEPNATKRLAFFLFVFVPGFWIAVSFVILMLVGIVVSIGSLMNLVFG